MSAFVATAFAQDDAQAASGQWRSVADQPRPKAPRLATLMVGAILLERNDEWAVSRRYMTLESIAPVSDNLTVKLPTVAA